MAKILGVGIATLDIINTIDGYPQEDSKSRIIKQRICRGGNVTNTLVVLSQLQHQCYWAGVWTNETNGQQIIKDLANYGININYCRAVKEGKVPTSYIVLNQQNASRTIMHYRDLPEFGFADFKKIDLTIFDWVHFEGRNIYETVQMIDWLKKNYPNLPISLEVEKLQPNIEILFSKVDVLMFSKKVAQCYNDNAINFLWEMRKQVSQAQFVCAWGNQGGYALEVDNNKVLYNLAHIPPKIVDTLGAGDTFNAGIIDGLYRTQSLKIALKEACELAGNKCGREGFDVLGY